MNNNIQYLKIQSKGEIDEKAFTIIGNSTKKGNNEAIGFFGSGLKYGISSLLRNNVNFKVFSGLREFEFTIESEVWRDTPLDIICINGKKTSFTVNLGASDWDNSFAPIREIYSNALDEDENTILEKSDVPLGEKGFTSFYIEMNNKIKDFYINIAKYFCIKNPDVLFSNEFGSVYYTFDGKVRLYRKGILCYEDEQKALFNYNSPHFNINESRVLSSDYNGKAYSAKMWRLCKNEKLIDKLIKGLSGGNSGRYEHNFSWSKFAGNSLDNVTDNYPFFTEEWGTVISKYKFVAAEHLLFLDENEYNGRMILPLDLLSQLQEQFTNIDILGLNDKSSTKYIVKEANFILSNKITDAINKLKESNYKFRFETLNITTVKFLTENVLGLAENNKIFLSVNLVDYSIDDICKIIIEENEHNLTGFSDLTRAFQDHLFNIYYNELIYGKKYEEFKEVKKED